MVNNDKKWKIEYRCVHCKRVINCNMKMYSDGCCPYCGHKGKDAGTIIETTEHPYYNIKEGKRWQFWKSKTRIYKLWESTN